MLRARKGYLLSLMLMLLYNRKDGASCIDLYNKILRLSSQDEVEVSQIQQRFILRVSRCISLETRLKLAEGDVFRRAMGVFGACYILPCKNLPVIPPKLTVDDFFIAYAQLKAGKPSIVSREIVAH